MKKLFKHAYHINGMSCGGCVSTVKQKLYSMPGIISVKVDLKKKEAAITSSEEIETDTLRRTFNNTHYTILEISA